MKEYLRQFYTEGLATTFHLKPINYLEKRIKNKKIRNVLQFLLTLFYTLLVLLFAGYIFYKKFPFK